MKALLRSPFPSGGASPPQAPLSKRARLARAIETLGMFDRLFWLRKRLGLRALTVLTYHRIGEADRAGELSREVFDVTPEELEDQLALIKRAGTVVSIGELQRFFQGGRLPPNPVLLTFDDGYVDNHAVALPILKRAAVPATFFIPTAYPEAGQLFWWDRVSLFMHRCRAPLVSLTYPARLTLTPTLDPEEAAARLCRCIKTTPNLDLPRMWEELSQASGVSLPPEEERALAAQMIMDWSAVRALKDAGMDVQSHSHRHQVLNTLGPEKAEEDLARSASILREVTGQPVHSVAYPVGYTLEGALRRAPAEAGFTLGFTNATGLGGLGQVDPLNLPRVSMDRGAVGSLFKLLLLVGDCRPMRLRRPT